MHSFPFPWPINYDRVFLMSQGAHTFITNSIWLKISFLFIKIMASCMAMSYKPQTTQMNEEPTPKSFLDLMFRNILVMKTSHRKRCALILKSIPLELGIITFFQILTPWWFCCRSTLFLVMNSKPYVKVITKLRTPPSSPSLQFPVLDTIVGCVVRFVNYLLIARQTI